MIDYIQREIEEHQRALNLVQGDMLRQIEAAARLITDAIKDGNKLLIFGNGGSASDAQHMAAEFTGRYLLNRKALPAIALTTDTSALTAIANDFGYEEIFARQIEAIAKPGDVVLGISTSGTSPNVLAAFKKAKALEAKIIGLSGRDGGRMNEYTDIHLNVSHPDTPRIQEMHILVIHILCGLAERELS